VKVKIPAFQNDANLGQTVTLAATNGYVAGVYNSRDQIWQANHEMILVVSRICVLCVV
jgi:hypothetical protein